MTDDCLKSVPTGPVVFQYRNQMIDWPGLYIADNDLNKFSNTIEKLLSDIDKTTDAETADNLTELLNLLKSSKINDRSYRNNYAVGVICKNI